MSVFFLILQIISLNEHNIPSILYYIVAAIFLESKSPDKGEVVW